LAIASVIGGVNAELGELVAHGVGMGLFGGRRNLIE
jgi:hypothetical protein